MRYQDGPRCCTDCAQQECLFDLSSNRFEYDNVILGQQMIADDLRSELEWWLCLLANKILWHNANMSTKPVQISMDTNLLRQLDADPEVKEKGRSAFIRAAIRLYLAARDRRETDARIAQAYAGEADTLLSGIEPLIDGQTWPEG